MTGYVLNCQSGNTAMLSDVWAVAEVRCCRSGPNEVVWRFCGSIAGQEPGRVLGAVPDIVCCGGACQTRIMYKAHAEDKTRSPNLPSSV